MRLLIVGGSDAGIAAALRARELDPAVEVTVLLADSYPNYSICGLPYYLSGDVPDWRSLAHRTTTELEDAGIELLLEHTATRIDAAAHTVSARAVDGRERDLRYDKLVVATGAEPVRPPLPGIDNEGVYQLHTIGDSLALNDALARHPASAVIVGAGYIGLEMAEALHARGLGVTVVEQLPTVLPTVDAELGVLVRSELERHDVRVLTGVTVSSIERHDSGLVVNGGEARVAEAEIVLVVVGVRPDTELAENAGVETSVRGALHVDRRMRTNLSNVYAAGDCVVTYHRLLDKAPTCRSAQPLTSKDVPQARTPSAANAASKAHWVRRSAKCSSSRSRAPASGTTKHAVAASTRSPSSHAATTTRSTTPPRTKSRCGPPATAATTNYSALNSPDTSMRKCRNASTSQR